MRYVMFTYPDADFAATYEQLPPEEIEADVARHMAWFQKHRAHIDGGEELGFPHEARTVRRRGGRVTITDGPFVETKEILGGFIVLEVADLDEEQRRVGVRAGGIDEGLDRVLGQVVEQHAVGVDR